MLAGNGRACCCGGFEKQLIGTEVKFKNKR
jgi:hypothetical protein